MEADRPHLREGAEGVQAVRAGRGPVTAASDPGPCSATTPYLRGLGLEWLDRDDDAAIGEADEFLTSHADDVDAERVGHDLVVYLCDWVVANSGTARWILNPRDGTCLVELGENRLDPYRHVVTCVADRLPVAHRFIEQAKKLAA